MADLQASIEELWERRDELSPADTDAAKLVEESIELLDTGQARVAEVHPAPDE
jgi:2,3,4,5-tetrahydropyridine-2-carboxylate N-succinyltransferase